MVSKIIIIESKYNNDLSKSQWWFQKLHQRVWECEHKSEIVALLKIYYIFIYLKSFAIPFEPKYKGESPQEVAQSAGTTHNKAEVISLNLHSSFCADISTKKKKKKSLMT